MGDEKNAETLALKIRSYSLMEFFFFLSSLSFSFLLLLLPYFSSSIAVLPYRVMFSVLATVTIGCRDCFVVTTSRGIYPPPHFFFIPSFGSNKWMHSGNVKTYYYILEHARSSRNGRRAGVGNRVIGNFIRVTKCQSVESRIKRIEFLRENN